MNFDFSGLTFPLRTLPNARKYLHRCIMLEICVVLERKCYGVTE
jgi:hypothetical protein